jgi:predicted enzyme related to lactoylglutathione lyase
MPTYSNGKICYLEIPATDIAQSVAFYETVFGWKTRRRGDDTVVFDDGVGEVSGSWVTGRPPSVQAGLMIYIMVDDAAATVQLILAHGGKLVQAIGADAPEITARFADPAGNVLGLYQQRDRT